MEDAKQNIQEALDLEPNNPRYLDLILDLSIMKKDKESALYYLEKLAEVNPENNKLNELSERIEAIGNRRFRVAVVAQLVEHLHGKEKVTGSIIPVNGSETKHIVKSKKQTKFGLFFICGIHYLFKYAIIIMIIRFVITVYSDKFI